MKQLARIQMIKFDALKTLSAWAETDSKQCSQHLLQALHVEHSMSERARSMQWHAIGSKKELERILANIQSKGGCGFMPGIYEVIDGQRVQNALQEGLVFSLNEHDEDAAVLVFLRDARISSLKSNWSLSLAGVSDQHLQAALWLLVHQTCKLNWRKDWDKTMLLVSLSRSMEPFHQTAHCVLSCR
jgi:hypothetical protein